MNKIREISDEFFEASAASTHVAVDKGTSLGCRRSFGYGCRALSGRYICGYVLFSQFLYLGDSHHAQPSTQARLVPTLRTKFN